MLKTNLQDIGNVPFPLPTTVSPHSRTGPNFLPLNTRMQKLHEVHPRWKVWRVFFSLIRLHFARGQKCCPRYLCRAVCSKFASNKTKQQQTKKRSGNPRNVVTSGWRHCRFFFLSDQDQSPSLGGEWIHKGIHGVDLYLCDGWLGVDVARRRDLLQLVDQFCDGQPLVRVHLQHRRWTAGSGERQDDGFLISKGSSSWRTVMTAILWLLFFFG